MEQNARLALQIRRRAYVLQTGRIILSGDSAHQASDTAVQEAYLGGRQG